MDKYDNYTSTKKVNIKDTPKLNEQWVQNIIENNPQILELGDLNIIARERQQQSGGRLDFLMEDDNDNRYTVEIQLGKTDESHIIRCLEYWDNERKRNPNKDYTAVIVAENITTRFFNVINLFNGCIPIIAIDMTCLEVSEGKYALVFTKILDKIETETEDIKAPDTDRAYWLSRSNERNLKIVDELFETFKDLSDEARKYNLNYNKFYIGIAKNGISNNFVSFRPQKQFTHIHIKRERTSEYAEALSNSNLEYQYKDKFYRISIVKDNLKNQEDMELIKIMMNDAFKEYDK